MSEPFLGEIRSFGFNFAPRGWAECNGQLLPISSHSALFSLLGTMYGGDGRTTFGLPDLRGRSSLHQGEGPGLSNVRMGQRGGTQSITLTTDNLPSHTHAAQLHGEDAIANKKNPNNKMLAKSTIDNIYAAPVPANNKIMAPESIVVQATGGGQAFANASPYLVVNMCIALEGLFPPRS